MAIEQRPMERSHGTHFPMNASLGSFWGSFWGGSILLFSQLHSPTGLTGQQGCGSISGSMAGGQAAPVGVPPTSSRSGWGHIVVSRNEGPNRRRVRPEARAMIVDGSGAPGDSAAPRSIGILDRSWVMQMGRAERGRSIELPTCSRWSCLPSCFRFGLIPLAAIERG